MQIEELIKLYELANDVGSGNRRHVDPLVRILSAYYMQSYDPVVDVKGDGHFTNVNVLLSTNTSALTLKKLNAILEKCWVKRVNHKGAVAIQNGVLYYPFKEYSYDDVTLRTEVCRYIKLLKDALCIKELDGNPLMIMLAPVNNPELYLQIINRAHDLGYSLNELLRVTGTELRIPDVRTMYENTGIICFTLGNTVLTYDEESCQFIKGSLELLTMGAF